MGSHSVPSRWRWMLCVLLCTWMPGQAHAATATLRPGKRPRPSARRPTSRPIPPKAATRRQPTRRPAPPKASPAPKKATALGPGHPLYRGIMLCRRARWDKARKFFLKVKQTRLLQLRRVDRPLLYLYLGLSYIHLLKQKEGMRAIESALLLNECTTLPKQLDLSPQIHRQFKEFSRPYRKSCERRRLAALKRRIAPPPRRRRVITPKQNAKLAKSRGIRLAAWLVLGTGTVALGSAFVAGGMSVLAEVRRNEQDYSPTGTVEYVRYHKLAEQRALVANVLFGTAGVLLFTGFALQLSQLIQPPPARPAPPRLTPPKER